MRKGRSRGDKAAPPPPARREPGRAVSGSAAERRAALLGGGGRKEPEDARAAGAPERVKAGRGVRVAVVMETRPAWRGRSAPAPGRDRGAPPGRVAWARGGSRSVRRQPASILARSVRSRR